MVPLTPFKSTYTGEEPAPPPSPAEPARARKNSDALRVLVGEATRSTRYYVVTSSSPVSPSAEFLRPPPFPRSSAIIDIDRAGRASYQAHRSRTRDESVGPVPTRPSSRTTMGTQISSTRGSSVDSLYTRATSVSTFGDRLSSSSHPFPSSSKLPPPPVPLLRRASAAHSRSSSASQRPSSRPGSLDDLGVASRRESADFGVSRPRARYESMQNLGGSTSPDAPPSVPSRLTIIVPSDGKVSTHYVSLFRL